MPGTLVTRSERRAVLAMTKAMTGEATIAAADRLVEHFSPKRLERDWREPFPETFYWASLVLSRLTSLANRNIKTKSVFDIIVRRTDEADLPSLVSGTGMSKDDGTRFAKLVEKAKKLMAEVSSSAVAQASMEGKAFVDSLNDLDMEKLGESSTIGMPDVESIFVAMLLKSSATDRRTQPFNHLLNLPSDNTALVNSYRTHVRGEDRGGKGALDFLLGIAPMELYTPVFVFVNALHATWAVKDDCMRDAWTNMVVANSAERMYTFEQKVEGNYVRDCLLEALEQSPVSPPSQHPFAEYCLIRCSVSSNIGVSSLPNRASSKTLPTDVKSNLVAALLDREELLNFDWTANFLRIEGLAEKHVQPPIQILTSIDDIVSVIQKSVPAEKMPELIEQLKRKAEVELEDEPCAKKSVPFI